MRRWVFSILGSVALIVIFATHPVSAAPSCTYDEWQALPEVLPSRTYESPNDPDLEYKRSVVRRGLRYRPWAMELGRGAKDFFSIQSTLAEWDRKLNQAEVAFWQDYAENKRTNETLTNEYAYWLHKRELWRAIRDDIIYEGKASGHSEFGKVFGFVLGGANPRGFHLPEAFSSISTPRISQSPKTQPFDEEYRSHFRYVVGYGYLTASPCSPRFSTDPIDKLTYSLIAPFGVTGNSSDMVAIYQWARANPNRVDELRDAITRFSVPKRISKLEAAKAFISDEPAALKKLSESLFLSLTEHFYFGFFSSAANRLYATEKKTVFTEKGYVHLGSMSVDEVTACAEENSAEIRSYVFDHGRSPEYMARLAASNPLKNTLYEDLGFITLVACVSPDSLGDLRVVETLKKYK